MLDKTELKNIFSDVLGIKSKGVTIPYAKSYAEEGLSMLNYDYSDHSLKIQLMYIRSNLSYYRGPDAKKLKARINKLIK